MDSITQGLLGGAVTQAAFGKRLGGIRAGVVGVVAGVAADLDIFIRSSSDPLLSIEYHRHFTHGLAFVPVGGLVVGSIMYGLYRWLDGRRRRRGALEGSRGGDPAGTDVGPGERARSPGLAAWWLTVLVAMVGYATHGPLDILTSYGTQIFWPFSSERVALDWIPIVDLVVSISLAVGLVLSWRRRRQRPAAIGLAIALAYMVLGGIQHASVMDAQATLASSRGHVVEKSRAIPTVLNLFLWRSIYEHDGQLHADAIWVPPWGDPVVWEGGSVTKRTPEELAAGLPATSTAAKDIARFAWFADGWLHDIPSAPGVVGDFRYTTLPDSLEPMWGMIVDASNPDDHVQRYSNRGMDDGGLDRFLEMLVGSAPGGAPLP